MEIERDRQIPALIPEAEQDSLTLLTTVEIVQDQDPHLVLLLTEEAADLQTLVAAGLHLEEALVGLDLQEVHPEAHPEGLAEDLLQADQDQEVINN